MTYLNHTKILLILDLDETLIHATHEQKSLPVDFMIGSYVVYKRLYLNVFFDSIKDDFLFAIWSSASELYVHEILKHIMPEFIKLEFIWSQSRCTLKRDVLMQYQFNPNYYEYIKPLKKLKNKGYSLERMLIVDDTPFKCHQNYDNAIYPKPFEGDENDNELLLLAQYLKTLKDKTNIRHIEKRNWRNQILQTIQNDG